MPSTAIKRGRIALPDLKDPNKYLCLPRTMILDPHWRKIVKKNEEGEEQAVEEYCGPDQLIVLCENSQERVDNGELGLVRIGHINTELPNEKESSQPEIIGYIPKFYMGISRKKVDGEVQDIPVILGDLYIEKEHENDLKKYPRRSPEIFGKNDEDGYIDGVALLNRPSFRDLGFITYSRPDAPYCHENRGKPLGVKSMDEAMVQKLAAAIAQAIASCMAQPEPMANEQPMAPAVADDGSAEMMAAECDTSGYPSADSTFVPDEEKKKKKPEEMASGKQVEYLAKSDKGKKDKGEQMSSDSSRQEIIDFRGEFEAFKLKTESRYEALAKENRDLLAENVSSKTATRRANRHRTLSNLNQQEGLQFDIKEELELCMKQSDDEFDAHIKRARKLYTRSIARLPMIPIDNNEGGNNGVVKSSRLTDRERDAKAVILYQKEHPELVDTDGNRLMSAFLSDTEFRKRFTID